MKDRNKKSSYAVLFNASTEMKQIVFTYIPLAKTYYTDQAHGLRWWRELMLPRKALAIDTTIVMDMLSC